MKYKRLTSEELHALEPDFVRFLATAQVTGPDWEKMKKEEIEKAEELIDVFSDIVYDKVLRKIQYLEYRDEKTMNVYYCGNEKIQLAGLRVKENSALDLTKGNIPEQWNEHQSAITIVRSEKKYEKEREEEVFELLQNGCLITDEKMFKILMKVT
jgi:hypothetical protein